MERAVVAGACSSSYLHRSVRLLFFVTSTTMMMTVMKYAPDVRLGVEYTSDQE